jgi:hypothetical protein
MRRISTNGLHRNRRRGADHEARSANKSRSGKLSQMMSPIIIEYIMVSIRRKAAMFLRTLVFKFGLILMQKTTP